MEDAGLDDCEWPDVIDGLDHAAETVADEEEHIVDAAILDLAEDLVPVLGALAAVTDPQADHIAHPVDGDPDNGVDGTVGDLAVADLTWIASMKITGYTGSSCRRCHAVIS